MIEISLKKAETHHCDLLLSWRNDKETRLASMNEEEIQPHEHQDWFTRSLQDPNRIIFIAEKNGEQIGMIRADLKKETVELSWLIAPAFRGKKFASPMLRAAIRKFSNKTLIANIKPENLRSIAMVKSTGFKLFNTLNSYLSFKLVT